MKYLIWQAMFMGILSTVISAQESQPDWRGESARAVLKNDALEATFQSGLLIQLKDVSSGKVLSSIDPAKLPSKMKLFQGEPIDLDRCEVSQVVKDGSIASRFASPDGVEWNIEWKLDDATGDLVLNTSARSPQPVEEFRFLFFGCDITDHSMIRVNECGVGEMMQAPWNGRVLGDPETDNSPVVVVPPLVVLFQGQAAGWLMEGREARIGPASILMRGYDNTATVGMFRRFMVPQNDVQMYEIRIRTYKDRWESAVDPYIRWMEEGAGFVPLERKNPAWVRDIKNQAAVNVGNFEALESLAKQVDPKKTFVGRQYGWRKYADPTRFPNYEVSDIARKWFARAKELGFRVGAGYSTYAVSPDGPDGPELVERFTPGFGIDSIKDGKPVYSTQPTSPSPVLYYYYCTPAYKPFRDYFVEQVGHAVRAGVDVIYLDEAAWPMGRGVVDNVDVVQGVMLLEKEILEAYPNVALETEQFNPMASRHCAFALTQMYAGHPLGGYIFHKFIHIVPEGIVSMPTEDAFLEAFHSYGYLTPGANGEPTWLDTARAFQEYDLVPDSSLAQVIPERLVYERAGGLMPAQNGPYEPAAVKLFGYRGSNSTTAFFERHPNQRGLVIYEPGKKPQWRGTRVFGVSQWSGPGVVREWIPGVEAEVDWFIYRDGTQLGLDPQVTYRLDENGTLPAERFHVTGIPDDFKQINRLPSYSRPQDSGRDGSYHKLVFSGNGVMTMHIPANVRAFMNGTEIQADPSSRSARVDVSGTTEKPSTLVAFPIADAPLIGRLTDLPWQTPPAQRSYFIVHDPAENPELFGSAISGFIVLSGKLPEAPGLRIQGAYKMRDDAHIATRGDGVVRVNGKELVRLAPGERPFPLHPFDADLAEFAGQNVLIEIISDGLYLAAPAMAEWHDVKIVSE